MRKPWVPNSKSVISLKICPCIHVFFLLYRIQGHFDYRAIVLPKLHIVQWQCLTVFFATKPPIYFSTIAVCLNASCSCTVWRKSLISDRRSLIDWSPAGCLHPSPCQPPPPASQLIDCYKVFAPSRSLSRPLLSETVFHSFFVHKHPNLSCHIFLSTQQYAVTTLVVHYKLISNVSCDIGFRNTFPRPNDSGDDP